MAPYFPQGKVFLSQQWAKVEHSTQSEEEFGGGQEICLSFLNINRCE